MLLFGYPQLNALLPSDIHGGGAAEVLDRPADAYFFVLEYEFWIVREVRKVLFAHEN